MREQNNLPVCQGHTFAVSVLFGLPPHIPYLMLDVPTAKWQTWHYLQTFCS